MPVNPQPLTGVINPPAGSGPIKELFLKTKYPGSPPKYFCKFIKPADTPYLDVGVI